MTKIYKYDQELVAVLKWNEEHYLARGGKGWAAIAAQYREALQAVEAVIAGKMAKDKVPCMVLNFTEPRLPDWATYGT